MLSHGGQCCNILFSSVAHTEKRVLGEDCAVSLSPSLEGPRTREAPRNVLGPGCTFELPEFFLKKLSKQGGESLIDRILT